MPIFGQVWLWSSLAFLLGAFLCWALVALPARRRVGELEAELSDAVPPPAGASDPAGRPSRVAVRRASTTSTWPVRRPPRPSAPGVAPGRRSRRAASRAALGARPRREASRPSAPAREGRLGRAARACLFAPPETRHPRRAPTPARHPRRAARPTSATSAGRPAVGPQARRRRRRCRPSPAAAAGSTTTRRRAEPLEAISRLDAEPPGERRPAGWSTTTPRRRRRAGTIFTQHTHPIPDEVIRRHRRDPGRPEPRTDEPATGSWTTSPTRTPRAGWSRPSSPTPVATPSEPTDRDSPGAGGNLAADAGAPSTPTAPDRRRAGPDRGHACGACTAESPRRGDAHRADDVPAPTRADAGTDEPKTCLE